MLNLQGGGRSFLEKRYLPFLFCLLRGHGRCCFCSHAGGWRVMSQGCGGRRRTPQQDRCCGLVTQPPGCSVRRASLRGQNPVQGEGCPWGAVTRSSEAVPWGSFPSEMCRPEVPFADPQTQWTRGGLPLASSSPWRSFGPPVPAIVQLQLCLPPTLGPGY